MATCRPGDVIIAPPPAIGGHVTHQAAGAAGLYGLQTIPAPVASDAYTVDVPALATLAARVRPKLITLGGSLNLVPHPVREVREIADAVGAKLLFDAAHLCGLIAGGAWPNPLAEGAHVMTMSTYKSLGGPPAGLVLSTDAEIAERVEAIAYPGLTANFDVAKTAALALTLVDWQVAGADYARDMVVAARRFADELRSRGLPVYADTRSHQFALTAEKYGGGQAAARVLRRSNLLACGIGLPLPEIDGDVNGLRLGTPEIVRIGVRPDDLPALAGFVARALEGDPCPDDVTAWRRQFDQVLYVA
jgi:glycine hydroxymethyltransferase